MVRTKPTITMDVMGYLDIRPEYAVAKYRESKAQDVYFVKPPNWDSPGDSIEMLVIHNQRENEGMLLLLEEMFETGKRQTITNATNIIKQIKNTIKIRKRFLDVNSFLKEWEDKKELALRKIRNEQAIHLELGKKIKDTHKSVVTLTEFRQQLLKTCEEYAHYETVLQAVVDQSVIYTSIKDLMDRCDALMMAQVDIVSFEKKKILEIQQMRETMLALTKKASLAVMGLKNELGDVQRSYTIAKQHCMKWERMLEKAKNFTAKAMLNRERTLDAIYHIYRILALRARHPLIYNRGDIEKQLDYIKNEIEVLQDILNEIHNANTAKSKTYKTRGTHKMNIPC